jgi:hypothetical protein
LLSIVNIIPSSKSDETRYNSEPSLAVNPADTQLMAATAFGQDIDATTGNAPIYVSQDGGSTWDLRYIVPDGPWGDITIAFSQGTLYAAKIPKFIAGSKPPSATRLKVLTAANFLDPSQPTMQVLNNPPNGNLPTTDQPWIVAATVPQGQGQDAGNDRLYVGFNNLRREAGAQPAGEPPFGASIDMCLNARAATPVFSVASLDKRYRRAADGPQTRLAVHPNGTIYAAYYHYRTVLPPFLFPQDPEPPFLVMTADVVVASDDNWGTSVNPFTSLPDDQPGGDRLPGCRIAQGIIPCRTIVL